MDVDLGALGSDGLRHFQLLKTDAVRAVTERFYEAHGSNYEDFGARGRESCREDLAYHLEFLHPVLEFGLLQPMVDYLRWLASVLAARSIPVDHVALSLDLLAAFFAEHMDAEDGAVVSAALGAVQKQFLQADDVTASSPGESWPEVAQFESALLAGQHGKALSVVSHCIDSGHNLVEVEQHVVRPSLYHIGEKWQANQCTVASEHLATAIAQSVMTMGLQRSPPPEAFDKRVLLACVAGNEHSLGLRMVADAFQLAGWDVQYLGANVPTSAIVRQAEDWKPHLIGLSVSFAQQLRVARQVIQQLGERLGSGRPAVIIGGLAINRFHRLAEMVGADAYSSDALSVVATARKLVASSQRI
jgi:MerR family transcriptional regulator, light-induced transcriptional regulator